MEPFHFRLNALRNVAIFSGNTGIGISSDEIDRVFDNFYQV